MRRFVAAIILPLLLVFLAGCGSDTAPAVEKPNPGTIADVTVTGDFGAKPEVQFKAPMAFAKTEHKNVIEGPGKGDTVTPDSTVKVNLVGINASDAAEFVTTWDDQGKPQPSTFQLADNLPVGFRSGLVGSHQGDRVLITVTPDEGFPTGNGTTIQAGDSLVFVVDIDGVTTPKPIPKAQLPTLELDKDGNPEKFVAKADTPKEVGLLGVYPITKGKGAKVTATQTLTVEYLGQIWPDGAVFDESYSETKTVTLTLDQVIPGWQQGLVGQTVGSRVILTIPSSLGYGPTGSGETIPPNADLIFVIDIQKAE